MKTNQLYPEELKIEAVQQITQRGHKEAEASARIGVSQHSLYKWIKAYGPPPEQRQSCARPVRQRARHRTRSNSQTRGRRIGGSRARTDVYLSGASHPFAEAVERCNAYREAGADCLFVPGASDPKTIEALVREINGPITVVMGLTSSPLTVPQLGSLGVRRVTVGGSLARATFGLIRRAAQEMVTSGTFSYVAQQILDAELSQFFADQRGSDFTM